jgi:hypothetical protein
MYCIKCGVNFLDNYSGNSGIEPQQVTPDNYDDMPAEYCLNCDRAIGEAELPNCVTVPSEEGFFAGVICPECKQKNNVVAEGRL